MRRLFIYLTYDSQNIIDDYIGYFLQSIRPIADTIAVVCNMPHIERGLHNLTDYADHIFYRENAGLDAGGFKDALCRLLGWKLIGQYDELILANDSFYGPFHSITGIFSEMESRKLDFWGLMKRGAGIYGTTGNDPEHILSFFYAFQAPLLHSREFRDYWESMPCYKDYMTVVKKYERRLTKHFADLGYTYGTYADTSPNETENLKNQFFQCDYLSYEMMTKRKFPFLKRKQMTYNTLYHQTQENRALSLEYIDHHTDYDVNLIWKNLIRTQNHTELQRSLGLQYILEGREVKKHGNVLLCFRAKWVNAAEYVMEYLEKVRMVCHIQIITDNEELMAYYQNQGLPVRMSEQSDIEVLQTVDTEQFQYICLLHDTDLSSDRIPSCTGKSYFYNVWENLVKDAAYMNSVISVLEEKPYLGMLMHPIPIFGKWLGKSGMGWEDRYGEVKTYLQRFRLNAVISREVPPIHVTDNFWIKASVIEEWKGKNVLPVFGGCEPEDLYQYLWTYMVQDSGKLTGIVESIFYASLNETNYHYYLKTFLSWLNEEYGLHSNLQEYKEMFSVRLSVDRCRKQYKIWYVYGTGEIAKRCFEWIKDCSAFIVSDGQKKTETFQGKLVLALAEVELKEEVGIVLCLSKENQDHVARQLEEKGFKNYYAIY